MEKDEIKNAYLKMLLGFIIICVMVIGFLIIHNDIGITSGKLKKDIRLSQQISDDWTIDGNVSNTMAAFISYPQSLNDYTFSVYVNRPGLSLGYFFAGGGKLGNIEECMVELTVEECTERAFISMNSQHISKLTIDNGISIRDVAIDSGKPFAIVMPTNAGILTFYDVNGNMVHYSTYRL